MKGVNNFSNGRLKLQELFERGRANYGLCKFHSIKRREGAEGGVNGDICLGNQFWAVETVEAYLEKVVGGAFVLFGRELCKSSRAFEFGVRCCNFSRVYLRFSSF